MDYIFDCKKEIGGMVLRRSSAYRQSYPCHPRAGTWKPCQAKIPYKAHCADGRSEARRGTEHVEWFLWW
jgi:hypothetical protein